MQKRKEPSGFLTNNTGDAQGELLGYMRPEASKSSSSFLIA